MEAGIGGEDSTLQTCENARKSYTAVDKDGVALMLADLAEIERRRGELRKALSGYLEARTVAQEIDDKRAVAYTLSGAADVLFDQGDLEASRDSYQKSLALRKEIGDKHTVAETELALSRLSIEEGHPADAETVIRKLYRQRPSRRYEDRSLATSASG